MKYITSINQQQYEIEIVDEENVLVNGKRHQVDFQPVGDQMVFSLLIDGQSFEAHVTPEGSQWEVLLRGNLYHVQVEDEREKRLQAAGGSMIADNLEFLLKAPMPGLVIDVPVEEGSKVNEGDVLIVLESMKMQNELQSPREGTVSRVRVAAGDSVDQNQALLSVQQAIRMNEIEVKFLVQDLSAVRKALEAAGAVQHHERTHEYNLRFDTADRELTRSFQALRLRKDNDFSFTYKGPGKIEQGVMVRKEIEFTVSDFSAARDFLFALGYKIFVIYEKYRTTYHLDTLEIMLDEMPYGDFVELEGPDGKTIGKTAALLGLNWESAITDSYLRLFWEARQQLHFTFRDLTFENFEKIDVTPRHLGAVFADA